MHIRSLLLGLPLLAALLPAQEAAIPLRFADAFPAQPAFDRPIYAAFTDHDPENCYVLTQDGTILAVPRDGTVDLQTVFFAETDRILSYASRGHDEEGLLGMAFAPDYADSGHVYLYYSEKLEGAAAEEWHAMPRRFKPRSRRKPTARQSVLSRFTAVEGDEGRTIDPGSELVVMTILQPFGNHNGGTLEFGPDGMLYVGLGDGGFANDVERHAQNTGTLLGSLLRIDVSEASAEQPYRIPDDNPFVGQEGARGEIWAYGIRNLWRFSFDAETGELWAADVGQNEWEEVDRIVKGGNYGWPIMEATHTFTLGREPQPGEQEGLILPVAEYDHTDGGISITGGYVYRGEAIPALQGYYIYTDYVSKRMWGVKEDREGGQHQVIDLGLAPANVSAFAQEPDGELLLLTFDGRSAKSGKIYRMLPGGS